MNLKERYFFFKLINKMSCYRMIVANFLIIKNKQYLRRYELKTSINTYSKKLIRIKRCTIYPSKIVLGGVFSSQLTNP